MNKKKIMLIANYWHFEEEKASSRYRTMAEVLAGAGFELEVVTSSFRHLTKKQRVAGELNTTNLAYKVTMLYEPDYKKNISMKRIYSHHRLAKNILHYLKKSERPDAIIVSVPSLSVGSAVTKFANKNDIPVVVDIQDLWPEAFKMAINIPVVSDILFAPMMIQANRIYKRADKIMAVSRTYVERGLKVNTNDKIGQSIYIGTDPELAKEAMEGIEILKPQNEFWIGYIGALGHSYDIKTVIDAVRILKEKNIDNIVLKIMGDGPLRQEFESYAEEAGIECKFTGFLDYGTMMATLSACDIAVNPIVGKSVSSIINKVSDYAIAGIPVVNTQNSNEYRELLESYEAGINAENGSAVSVADAIFKLYSDSAFAEKLRENAKKMGMEKFDRNKTYKAVINLIEDGEKMYE